MLKSQFDPALSEPDLRTAGLNRSQGDALFDYFRNNPVFKWHLFQNDCEDRANAVCILLDSWKIPNYKAWVFSGSFLKSNEGNLHHSWKFHVAPLIVLDEGNGHQRYVIDPAMLGGLTTLEEWGDLVTQDYGSLHFVTRGDVYIFMPGRLKAGNWYRRNRQNYKWTIQRLAGINGVSATGKAQLCFCKPVIAATERRFKRLMDEKPAFLKPRS